MTLPVRFAVVCAAVLLAGGSAVAQLPVAPEPHLALDELVKEYKRLGLPLPPANAELVRVQLSRLFRNHRDELGFRIPPTKPEERANCLVGSASEAVVTGAEPVKPVSDTLKGIEPEYVSNLLCLAVQCRVRGWNEFAELLYARAREAITTPVPAQMGSHPLGGQWRVNGWELRTENSSVLTELRLTAEAYWHPRVMDSDSDRQEVLHYLKVLYPGGHEDIRDLERTLVPRKSKPGTVEALIDDLIDWTPDEWSKSGKQEGRVAYWKLVELGFDAVPTLLEHIEDERLTRYTHEELFLGKTIGSRVLRVRVRHVVGQLLNDLSGRELSKESGPPTIDADKARAWWEKARTEGEEKWLVAHAAPEFGRGSSAQDANRVLFRALGTKYPARLGEFYQTVLSKHPRRGSHVLADELAASKLPRAEKLALLVEGAEHKHLTHRLAALTVLAKLDPPLFRKHLLVTLQKLPPEVDTRARHYEDFVYQECELASLVWRTNDPACWNALAELTKQSDVYVRVEIIRHQFYWPKPDGDKASRRELLRFLLQFISDESAPVFADLNDEEVFGLPVWRVATETLAGQLGVELPYNPSRGPLSRFFVRAVVAKAAAEELERLKK